MDWRWSWLWSILWNILVHAVTFNWNALSQDGASFRSWWQSLWGEIEGRVNGVRDWASGRISYLQGYAFGLFYQLGMDAARWVSDLRSSLTSWINSIISWAQASINWLRSYADDLYNRTRSFAQSIVNGVYSWARPYIDSAVNWVRGLYEWIQPYRDLITGWLVQARVAIDWLWHYGRAQLQAFLSDPLGYVLGSWLIWIRSIVNWWQLYGAGLMTFVAQELADLRTTWANGKRIIKALVENPERFIFDLLAPKFLDWLADLIAANW